MAKNLFGGPLLDSNGVAVPDSYYEAVETGALSFFSDEPCPDCGTCKRFYVDGLKCYGCTNPPAPMWTCVAPDLATADARAFRRYSPAVPCEKHPHAPFTTVTQRCEGCEREEGQAEFAERQRVRDEAAAAEQAALRATLKAERERWKAERADAVKLEKSTRVITQTVGMHGEKGKRTTLTRAVVMEAALPEQHKTKQCHRCKSRRVLSQFAKDNSSWDKLYRNCRPCCAELYAAKRPTRKKKK
jgi:hypothetical protein